MASRIRAPKDMGEVVDLVRRLPTYIRLVWALLRDGRVPAAQKLILAGIGGYLFFPIDLIPDFVPVLGQLDDLAVVLLGLDLFIRSAPAEIVEEHLAKISQNSDQLRRDIATAERLLGDRLDEVRGNVDKFRTRDRKTTARNKKGSTT
ncbi:MAG TPA: YkvA family protein [Candidatus Limnocylindria bacterium]